MKVEKKKKVRADLLQLSGVEPRGKRQECVVLYLFFWQPESAR